MTPHRLAKLTAFATTALVLSACTTITGANVEAKTEADATAAVQQYAEQVATVTGSPLIDPRTNASSCTGKLGETDRDIYTVTGFYRIAVPARQHVVTAARLRDTWTASGWKITDDRTFGDSEAVIAAEAPDGYGINVESNASGTHVAVMVSSPCFKSPTPR